ncbi:DUF3769 domain-containing protein, partial [Dolichospermum circinale CS-537/05]|nr:DUF3769 domain-containing protein [Dolichospermum circinale CS-537/05]
MFHPALPPQPPPNLVSSKPVSDLAATAVIQVKNDQQKLIIDGKKQQDQYQSTTKPSNDSPLSQLEKSSGEFSIIQGQKRKIIYNIAGQQVVTETSTPPVEKNYVNLQESAGKVDLLVGEKTPSLPVQNLIEFKLRNPQD